MNVTTAVKDIPHLCELQVVQFKPDEIVVNAVKSPGYNADDENNIQRCLKERFGPSVKLKISYLNRIERTNGGKFKVLVSKV